MDLRRLNTEGTADARAINRTNESAWREAYDELVSEEVLAEFEPDPSEPQLRQMAAHLRDDRDGIFLAEINDTVRGYGYVRWGDETKSFVGSDEAGLKELYVEPNDWGQGIGTALLEHCIEAVPDSVERLRLEMLVGNDIGRRFYENRGFERTGESEFVLASEAYSTVVYTREL
jgi:ribosomal protein S18 acetylase RimI-like enzyme